MNLLFNVTNHKATQEQIEDAKKSLGIKRIVEMPDDLARLWANVPPSAASVQDYSEPVLRWLLQNSDADDVIWLQGEWGVVISLLDWLRDSGVRCVYATTSRVAEEEHIDGQVQMRHVFKHVRYRDYPRVGG